VLAVGSVHGGPSAGDHGHGIPVGRAFRRVDSGPWCSHRAGGRAFMDPMHTAASIIIT